MRGPLQGWDRDVKNIEGEGGGTAIRHEGKVLSNSEQSNVVKLGGGYFSLSVGKKFFDPFCLCPGRYDLGQLIPAVPDRFEVPAFSLLPGLPAPLLSSSHLWRSISAWRSPSSKRLTMFAASASISLTRPASFRRNSPDFDSRHCRIHGALQVRE